MNGRRAQDKGARQKRTSHPAQAAVEYLTTYGWAIIIIAVVIAILYLFVLSPTSIAPTKCSLSTGVYCTDILFGSNGTASKAVMILSNSQQYPILNPTAIIDVNGKGNVSARCTPGYVLPGGSILCIANISSSFGQGSYVAGSIYVTSTTCQSGTNQSTCVGTSAQTYSGIINAHVQPVLSANTITLTLTVANGTQTANGAQDEMTGNVKLLGYPYQGASVIFSVNRSSVILAPPEATSDDNGNANSYVSSNVTGQAIVTATFAGISASQTVTFAPPVYITLDSNVTACPTCIVAILNGVGYTQAQVNNPLTVAVAYGSRQVYAYIGIVTNAAGNTRDVIQKTDGCGDSQQNGTFVATFNCTVNSTYQLQYLLTESASDPDGSVTPGTSWIDAKTALDTSTSAYTPPSSTRYVWNCWSGSGTGSTSSCSVTAPITMYGPITEVAQYITQYYISMSSYPSSGGSTSVDGNVSGSGWYDRATYHSLGYSTSGGYAFGGWSGTSGGYLQVTAPISATANFDPCITATDTGGGYETGSGCYSYGGSAYLTANPDGGWEWDSWSDGGGQDHYVTVYSPSTYTAYYSLIPTTTVSNATNVTTVNSTPTTTAENEVCVQFVSPELSNGAAVPSGLSGDGTTGGGQSYECYPPGSNVNMERPSNSRTDAYQFEYWLVNGSVVYGSSFTIYGYTTVQAVYYPYVDLFSCVNGQTYVTNTGKTIQCAGAGSIEDGSGGTHDAFQAGATINLRASGSGICNPSSPASVCFVGYAAEQDVNGGLGQITCELSVNNAFNLNYYTQVRAYWCSPGTDSCSAAITNCWNNR